MKYQFIQFLVFVVFTTQAFAQGDLHVKGKIRSDSLANQNYLIIYADSTGTLDTLPAGLPGQVLISNGVGQKPTWTTISTSGFNPLYPDGTDSLIGVAVNLIDSTPYIVPVGKNLHITGVYKASPPNSRHLLINGDTVMYGVYVAYYANLSFILGPGDTVSTNVNTVGGISFVGYLANPVVTPITHRLTGNSYTVPNGKILYINFISVSLAVLGSSNTMINGVKIGSIYRGYEYNGIPHIINPGDVISSTNANNADVVFNGYLK